MASHRKFVAALGMGLSGAMVLAAFVAPFFGALDRPVVVVAPDGGTAPAAASNGVTVEKFDYQEPSTEAGADDNAGGKADQQPETPAQPDMASRLADAPEIGSELATPEKPQQQPQAQQPGSQSQAADQAPAGERTMQLLPRVVATAAGRLESNGLSIDLDDIVIMPVSDSCTSPEGEVWPCGMQARTAFRGYLRSRAVMCDLPQDGATGMITTTCKLGEDDPAHWLVENGWARAVPGGAYADIGREAEQNHRGIFGSKPSSAMPQLHDSLHDGTTPTENGAIQPETPPETPQEAAPAPMPQQAPQQNGAFPPAPPPPAQ